MQVRYSDEGGSEKHDWTVFLSRSTLFLAVVLAGAAVVCAVAANWQALSFFQRFAGLQTLLAVCALVAMGAWFAGRNVHDARQNIPPALLCAAAIFTGALLALFGQHYQTGADPFTLFGLWAILILPWALTARSRALWLLEALVINVFFFLWLSETGGRLWNGDVYDAFWLWPTFGPAAGALSALLNVILLAAWERIAGNTRGRACQWILALIAVATATYAVVAIEYSPERWREITLAYSVWVALMLGGGFYYSLRRPDRAILALLSAAFIAVSLRLAFSSVIFESFDLSVVPLIALMLLAEAAIAARWLMRVGPGQQTPQTPVKAVTDASLVEAASVLAPHSVETGASAPLAPAVTAAGASVPAPSTRTAAADPAGAASPDTAAPWYVQALLGFAAWLATGLLLLFLVFVPIVRSEQAAAAGAVILCLLAVVLVRTARGLFWRQLASALGFAGFLLAIYGYFSILNLFGGSLVVGLLAIVVYVSAPDRLLRFLAGGTLAFALTVLIWFGSRPGRPEDMVSLWAGDISRAPWNLWLPTAFVIAAIAAAAFLTGPRLTRVRTDSLVPLAWAFALFSQTAIWRTGGVSVLAWPALWHLTAPSATILAATACLPVAAALGVLYPRRAALSQSIVWGVPLGLLALALFWLPAPGIALALTWMLLGFGLGQTAVLGFGLISLLIYLSAYYYQLDVPLLEKALWLIGAAVMLGALRVLVWLIPRITAITTPVRGDTGRIAQSQKWRFAGVLAGLVLILAVVNAGAWQRERLLASGRVVLLALAPVDPRSLLQGDYMALSFDQLSSVQRLVDNAKDVMPDPDHPSAERDSTRHVARSFWPSSVDDGYAILSMDGDNVAKVIRIQPDVAPHASDEIALRYRVRNGRVRMTSDAFFFAEGQASHYNAARYGEFRVGEDGSALLVGLRDADRKPL